MSWYYSKSGVQLGPVSREELAGKASSGEVLAGDLIWQEGMTDWKPLSQVPEFQGVQAVQSAPPIFPTGGAAVAQPAYAAAPYSGPEIPNYLWQSIVVTVLCCLPFGVVSIVYAAKVDSLKATGDIVGAQAASKSAKTWAIVGLASWGAVIAIYLVIAVLAAVAGNM
ncbi:CD225/dispanin family protein [Luteolibacter sp. AS25]|uniref:CD225/dispanin family protein n=1 Tax=Luteolibacter sp. AS25 TaxID=3135776 RepID=UPI00398AEC97